MKRSFILCLMAVFFVVTASGQQQQQLKYEDRSGSFDVFTGESNEAGMVVICSEAIALTFASNRDQAVDVFKTEVKGSDKYYYIRLLTGRRYEGRQITVYARYEGPQTAFSRTPSYAPTLIGAELQPKVLKTIFMWDPNVIGRCYDQKMNEGLEIFLMAQYPDARVKYRQAAECVDAPATALDEIQQKINIIDTIIERRRVADLSFSTGDYSRAYSNYQAAFSYNSSDQYVRSRMSESRTQMGIAEVNAQKADRRRQRTFVMAYEGLSQDGQVYGGTLGWYRNKKCGVYFSGHVKSVDLDTQGSGKNEMNFSMGLTHRLFRFTSTNDTKMPFGTWLSLGVGGTLAEGEDYAYKIESGWVATPEAGLLIKLGPIVLKYTFQYRLFGSTKENNNTLSPAGFFGEQNHVAGIGLCF